MCFKKFIFNVPLGVQIYISCKLCKNADTVSPENTLKNGPFRIPPNLVFYSK